MFLTKEIYVHQPATGTEKAKDRGQAEYRGSGSRWRAPNGRCGAGLEPRPGWWAGESSSAEIHSQKSISDKERALGAVEKHP